MKVIKSCLFLVVLIVFSCNSTKKEGSKVTAKNFNPQTILDLNVLKTKECLKGLASPDSFPRNIDKDKTDWNFVDVKDWCSGFWPGVLWYAYEASGDEKIKEQAERFTNPIKTIAYSPAENHDIGFMVSC